MMQTMTTVVGTRCDVRAEIIRYFHLSCTTMTPENKDEQVLLARPCSEWNEGE